MPNTPPQKKRSPWVYALVGFFAFTLLVTIFGEKKPIAEVEKQEAAQRAVQASSEAFEKMRQALAPGAWTPRVGDEKQIKHVRRTAEAFNEAAAMLQAAKPKTPEEKQLVEKYRKALIQHQKEEFPKLREKYTDVGFAPGYSTVGIISGSGKRAVLFASRGLKEERDFQAFLDNHQEELLLLRFTEIQFQPKYDGEITSYALKPPKDTDLVPLQKD